MNLFWSQTNDKYVFESVYSLSGIRNSPLASQVGLEPWNLGVLHRSPTCSLLSIQALATSTISAIDLSFL